MFVVLPSLDPSRSCPLEAPQAGVLFGLGMSFMRSGLMCAVSLTATPGPDFLLHDRGGSHYPLWLLSGACPMTCPN